MDLNGVKRSYDAVADEYVTHIYDELRGKPFDREQLEKLAQRARTIGPICDLGCGPGQIAHHLHQCGAEVCGIDLSTELVKKARTLNPEIEFQEGNMLALPVEDSSFGGIAAFYSLVNIPRADLPIALSEMHRVLRPGGFLLTAFHIGDETVHREEWWGKSVFIDFYFFRPQEIADAITASGLTMLQALEREPYPEVEHPSRRAYLWAQKR